MNKELKKTLITYFIIFIISFGFALYLTSIFQISIVNGESMCPTLQNGDILIVNKKAEPQDQDIITLSSEGVDGFTHDSLVKRYYANLSDEDFVWVEGDNKPNSVDSRSVGVIDRENINGVVVFNVSEFFRCFK